MKPTMGETNDQAESLIFDSNLPSEERVKVLMPLIYKQLRACAQEQLNAARPGHTLSATALVHEAWIKLAGPRRNQWQNSAHFFKAGVQAMRQILLDYEKARRRIKRGGGRAQVNIEEAAQLSAAGDGKYLDPIALNEAIRRLEERDPRAAEVVELRFYAGLTEEQTGHVIGVSASTVKYLWQHARQWLAKELHDSAGK